MCYNLSVPLDFFMTIGYMKKLNKSPVMSHIGCLVFLSAFKASFSFLWAQPWLIQK